MSKKIRKVEGTELLKQYGFEQLCFENIYFEDLLESYYLRSCSLKNKCYETCKNTISYDSYSYIISNYCSKVEKCEAINDYQLLFKQSYLGFEIEKSTSVLTIVEKDFEIILDFKTKKIKGDLRSIPNPFKKNSVVFTIDHNAVNKLANWAAEKLPKYKDSALSLIKINNMIDAYCFSNTLEAVGCDEPKKKPRLRPFPLRNSKSYREDDIDLVFETWEKGNLEEIFLEKMFTDRYHLSYVQNKESWELRDIGLKEGYSKTVPEKQLEMGKYIFRNARDLKNNCFYNKELFKALYESEIVDLQHLLWLKNDFDLKLTFSEFKEIVGKDELNCELVFYDAFENFLSQYGSDDVAIDAFKNYWHENNKRVDESFSLRSFIEEPTKKHILSRLKQQHLVGGRPKARDIEKIDILFELIDEDSVFGLNILSNNRPISKVVKEQIEQKLLQ